MKNANTSLLKSFVMLSALSLAAAVSAAPVFAAADAYPTKVVRLIVTTGAGGSTDVFARTIAVPLAQHLGQPVIVENRGGGGGVIGGELVAKSAPDGYTLLFTGAHWTTNPAFHEKLPFHTVDSFIPIARLGALAMALIVHPSVPAKSPQELVALMKQKPGQLICSAAEYGATGHTSAVLFKLQTGTDFKIVNFKSAGAASVDLLGGHSHLSINAAINNLSHFKTGKLRALAVCGDKRSPFLPELPSLAESGIPGVDVTGWTGILAPAGTPAPIVDRLHKEIKASLDSDFMQDFFKKNGVDPGYLGPAEFKSFLYRDLALWKRVVKEGNLEVSR